MKYEIEHISTGEVLYVANISDETKGDLKCRKTGDEQMIDAWESLAVIALVAAFFLLVAL